MVRNDLTLRILLVMGKETVKAVREAVVIAASGGGIDPRRIVVLVY